MPLEPVGPLPKPTGEPAGFEVAALIDYSDPDALKKISELTAAKWFEQREDIRKNYPGGYESFKWELSPGQDVRLRFGIGTASHRALGGPQPGIARGFDTIRRSIMLRHQFGLGGGDVGKGGDLTPLGFDNPRATH